jgi:transposase
MTLDLGLAGAAGPNPRWRPVILEVVETGRRRRWSDDEKLRVVLESLETPRAISSTARRHGISRSLLMTWRRAFRPEPMDPEIQQTDFVRAMVATAGTVAAEPGARASGRMVIEFGDGISSSIWLGVVPDRSRRRPVGRTPGARSSPWPISQFYSEW